MAQIGHKGSLPGANLLAEIPMYSRREKHVSFHCFFIRISPVHGVVGQGDIHRMVYELISSSTPLVGFG